MNCRQTAGVLRRVVGLLRLSRCLFMNGGAQKVTRSLEGRENGRSARRKTILTVSTASWASKRNVDVHVYPRKRYQNRQILEVQFTEPETAASLQSCRIDNHNAEILSADFLLDIWRNWIRRTMRHGITLISMPSDHPLSRSMLVEESSICETSYSPRLYSRTLKQPADPRCGPRFRQLAMGRTESTCACFCRRQWHVVERRFRAALVLRCSGDPRDRGSG